MIHSSDKVDDLETELICLNTTFEAIRINSQEGDELLKDVEEISNMVLKLRN